MEIGDKSDTKNHVSKIAKPALNAPGMSRPGPMAKPTATKQATLNSSAAYNTSQSSTMPPPPSTTKTALKGKAKAPSKNPDGDIVDPSQMMQLQMAARVKQQIKAVKKASGSIDLESENIELPDIHSEYSDSEDEGRPRTFDPPDWAQSPELRQALEVQSRLNPDEVFGAVGPLRMEEIFRTRSNRFRARTSSANWVGSDRLTVEEEREYVRRMGFE